MDSLPSSAMPDIDDATLVARSRAGDTEAFAQIVARYQSLICALTFSATGRQSQSKDLAQETFVIAWKKLGELREPEKLRAWLCGIARNLCLSLHRENRREPTHQAEPLENAGKEATDAPDPATLAMRKDEEAIVWRALEQMPEIYREPLVLYYRQHQSIEHVAVELDLSEEVVRQRLSRGRKMLNEQVAAIVQGTLAMTGPGRVFTNNVMAALPPLGLAAGKAASAAAGATATAAKSLAAAKGTSAISLLVTMFWPTTAIIAAFRLAVFSGGPDPTKEQIEARDSKPRAARMLFELIMIGAMLGTGIHYLPIHPYLVFAGIAGFFIVQFAVTAWHNPQQAKIWFSPWQWDSKAVWRFTSETLISLAQVAAVGFVTIHYRHATLIVLRLACASLFVTLMLLGLKKLKRWDWWRLGLKNAGGVTFWVMIFTIDDYWSAHPIEFLGAALWLFLGFTIARLTADKWEAQTSADPEKLRLLEEKLQKGKEFRLKGREARDAVAADFKALMKSQWAMTKKPRIALIALFIIFVLALPKQGDTYLNSNPAFFTVTAYVLIGLMSLSCAMTFHLWRRWQQRYLEKIQTVRDSNDWMEVVEHLPMLTNIVLFLIALRIFFNLDNPSIPLTAAAIILGAGCGVLARGLGLIGKSA